LNNNTYTSASAVNPINMLISYVYISTWRWSYNQNIADTFNKIVKNYWNRVTLDGNLSLSLFHTHTHTHNRMQTPKFKIISLLTAFSKLVYDRLITHIENNNILVNEQYRFRTHSSIEKAAFTLINDILTVLNSKIIVGGIFDLQEMFDCVNHTVLMNKL
jgi:hypothetical protein